MAAQATVVSDSARNVACETRVAVDDRPNQRKSIKLSVTARSHRSTITEMARTHLMNESSIVLYCIQPNAVGLNGGGDDNRQENKALSHRPEARGHSHFAQPIPAATQRAPDCRGYLCVRSKDEQIPCTWQLQLCQQVTAVK